jgi:hypothetical protein
MAWFEPTSEEEQTEARKSGTKWWYIAGVAIAAGTG